MSLIKSNGTRDIALIRQKVLSPGATRCIIMMQVTYVCQFVINHYHFGRESQKMVVYRSHLYLDFITQYRQIDHNNIVLKRRVYFPKLKSHDENNTLYKSYEFMTCSRVILYQSVSASFGFYGTNDSSRRHLHNVLRGVLSRASLSCRFGSRRRRKYKTITRRYCNTTS